jgi:hypothetical protein
MRRWPISSPVAGPGVIAVRVQALGQLFDSLDPSPSHEQDVSPKVEEYIVESVHELSAKPPMALVVYIEQAEDLPDGGAIIGDAIRGHFARRARLLQRKLRRLLRRGVVSLAIGLAFLVAVLLIRTFVGQMMGERSLTALFRESLLIVVWVAMWRPLEILLYDWWPIVGERRLHDRLSRIPVRIMVGSTDHRTQQSA